MTVISEQYIHFLFQKNISWFENVWYQKKRFILKNIKIKINYLEVAKHGFYKPILMKEVSFSVFNCVADFFFLVLTFSPDLGRAGKNVKISVNIFTRTGENIFPRSSTIKPFRCQQITD